MSNALPEPPARGQVQTLSTGDAVRQWREAQLQAFDRQLADEKLPDELKREITAQRAWLEAWEPKPRSAGSAEEATAASAPDAPSDNDAASEEKGEKPKQQKEEPKQEADDGAAKEPKPLAEPTIDPDGLAKELRERLFDPKRPATASDTKALQTALAEHSGDAGLRQLQLHWIDQPIYRDTLWQEIANSADRVLALLSDLPSSAETNAAAAFANYRKARALAHALHGRPLRSSKIAGVDKLSDADREQMQNAIGECWRQIETLVGAGHPEFFQLEMYSLRRYGWSGQALELLERHASAVDELAYLSERRSILEALGWTPAAEQTAAQIKAKSASSDAKPKRNFEIQYVASADAK